MQSCSDLHFFTISNALRAALATVVLFGTSIAWAAETVPIKLWKDGAPGTPGTKAEDEPVLLMSKPTSNGTSTGIIVIPGGGYGGLAMDHEGAQVAEWLNSLGITAFVLKYRMHGTGHM